MRACGGNSTVFGGIADLQQTSPEAPPRLQFQIVGLSRFETVVRSQAVNAGVEVQEMVGLARSLS